MVYASSFIASGNLFWPWQAPGSHVVHSHIYIQTPAQATLGPEHLFAGWRKEKEGGLKRRERIEKGKHSSGSLIVSDIF